MEQKELNIPMPARDHRPCELRLRAGYQTKRGTIVSPCICDGTVPVEPSFDDRYVIGVCNNCRNLRQYEK